jgi:CxxC motif-containing protein (DUF1111 family)
LLMIVKKRKWSGSSYPSQGMDAGRFFSLFFKLIVVFPSLVGAEDVTLLGGDLTTELTGRAAIQVFAPNISEQNKAAQLEGFTPFHNRFNRRTGLGPSFVNRACGDCHVNNGRGPVRVRSSSDRLTTVVVKISRGNRADGTPKNVPGVGEQLQDSTLQGSSNFDLQLNWTPARFFFNDGSKVVARFPMVSFALPAPAPALVGVSIRMSPLLIGLGLLEAIPAETILALSDPSDANGDGISGRPQYIPDLETGGRALGRFGFRASHSTVVQQSAAAAFHDMGITNEYFPGDERTLEFSKRDLENLVVYLALAGVPAARNQADPQVQRGSRLFSSIGCVDCHIMTLTTGSHPLTELENQIIHPFTDLLLHDMGKGLSDTRPEYEASGSEWRTTALWGIGYSSTVSDVAPRYLHDGRARTIQEAILWHGGEALKSRRSFQKLDSAAREDLLAFLGSL